MLSTSSILGHGGSKCLSGVCSSCILFASSSGIKRARWLQCRTKTATTAPLWPGACSIYSPTLRRHALQLPTTYVTVLFTPQPHIPTARSLLSSEHTTNETVVAICRVSAHGHGGITHLIQVPRASHLGVLHPPEDAAACSRPSRGGGCKGEQDLLAGRRPGCGVRAGAHRPHLHLHLPLGV